MNVSEVKLRQTTAKLLGIIHLEPHGGENILHTVARAQLIASAQSCAVVFIFNGVNIEVFADDDPNELGREYYRRFDERTHG